MFAILRMEKLKNRQQMKAAMGHNLRTIPVPNSNPDKTELNYYLGATDFASFIHRMEKRFQENDIEPRKDAVQAVEFVMSASPEFWKGKTINEITEWGNSSVNFIHKKFGKENVLNVSLHLDESNPHIHLILTPITPDGRLSCKDLLGGKAKLSKLQTDYANHMAKYGLKRGIEKSNAKHTTIKQFYTLANKIKQLTKEQLKEVAELLAKFEAKNKANANKDNSLVNNIYNKINKLEIESNLQLLKTINKVKPHIKKFKH